MSPASPLPFETATVREALEHRDHADQRAATTTEYYADCAAANADVVEKKNRFGETLTQDAAALADAQRQADDFAPIVLALDDIGGPKAIRERHLTTDAVFATLAKAFDERANAIEKLTKPALRELGVRRQQLTELGIGGHTIENDPVVGALCAFSATVTSTLAMAVASKKYCLAKGVAQSGGPRTFDSLLGVLVSPLPVAPIAPAMPVAA